MYHANYVTYFKRAIEHACGASGVRVHAIHSMKYRAAATLGEVVSCTGNLVSSGRGERSRWQFELYDAVDPSRVFVTAEAIVSWPGGTALPPGTTVGAPSAERTTSQADSQLLHPLPEAFADSPKTLEVIVWSDDLDGGGQLSIRALLNYFERIRTLSLGRGPDGEMGLMRLHREGVSVVVSGFIVSVSAGVFWRVRGFCEHVFFTTRISETLPAKRPPLEMVHEDPRYYVSITGRQSREAAPTRPPRSRSVSLEPGLGMSKSV